MQRSAGSMKSKEYRAWAALLFGALVSGALMGMQAFVDDAAYLGELLWVRPGR
jgi:hypothetical protein